jgi:hemerythrin-like domain-containing protein
MIAIERRGLLVLGSALGAGLLTGCASVRAPAARDQHGAQAEDVFPPEDLMREHGVLRRLLLVYEESARRLAAPAEAAPTATVSAAAALIKKFVEDYHEKLEEDHLFPRFRKAGKLVDLVTVLAQQHEAGRRLTRTIQEVATSGAVGPGRPELVTALHAFIRMYRPHAAREDTVLFPALRSVVTPQDFDLLGDQFEDQEHALFGPAGFENVVAEVAKLEESLGIHDLTALTPA